MALTNAERQRRWRVRLKAMAQSSDCLTPEEKADRDAVMVDPIYPVPKDSTQIPTFMGWNRYEWARAPEPLVEHFGMRDAWQRWRREIDDLCVAGDMPPEFDRGGLYREWKADSDKRMAQYRARRESEEMERQKPRGRRGRRVT